MTMTQRVGTWVAATVLSVTGGLVPVASAQERLAASPAQAAKPAGGMGEGIKVHGHWTIEVRNPDGSLVSVHKFQNALVRRTQFDQVHIKSGEVALIELFAGFAQGPPSWEIAIADGTDPAVFGWFRGGPCDGTPTNATPGVCVESATVGVSANGAQLTAAITAGSGAGQEGKRVGVVGTRVRFGRLDYIFSSHELSPPLTIAPGQILQVIVVFSFS